MQEKLWYFSIWSYLNYEIKEAQVIEETRKQFVIDVNGWKQTIIKKLMWSSTDCLFFRSKKQAERGLIDYLKKEFADGKTKMKSIEKEILEYKAILKERFNIEVE